MKRTKWIAPRSGGYRPGERIPNVTVNVGPPPGGDAGVARPTQTLKLTCVHCGHDAHDDRLHCPMKYRRRGVVKTMDMQVELRDDRRPQGVPVRLVMTECGQ